MQGRSLAARHGQARVGDEVQPVTAQSLVDQQGQGQRERRQRNTDEAHHSAAGQGHAERPNHEQGRGERGRAGDDGREQQGSGCRCRPGARGGEPGEEQPRQQQVHQNRGRTCVGEGDQKGRGQHPERGGQGAQAAAVGQPGRGHPGANGGEGKGERVDQYESKRRRPERNRAEHGHNRGERIGGADEAEPQVAPAEADTRPQFGQGRRQRQQPAAGEGVGAEQRHHHDDAHDRSGEHGPGAAAGEESNLGAFAVQAEQARLALERVSPAHLIRGNPQRGDGIPTERARFRKGAAGVADAHSVERGAERGREFAHDRAGFLAQQLPERAHKSQRQQRQPVKNQGSGGRVDQPAVQLR